MEYESTYSNLLAAHICAMNICDPTTYAFRQQNLLHFLAAHVLQRDKPIDETKDEGV